MEKITYKILLIEDDIFGITYIESILHETAYEIVGIAKNLIEAKSLLKSLRPDILISDINLGNDLVFDALNEVNLGKLPIIFITSMLHEAIFKQTNIYPNSLFITKPFHKFTLLSALSNFASNVKVSNVEKFIKVSGKKTRININVTNIKYIESEGNYSTIHLFDGKRFSKKVSLKYFESNFANTFARIHQSYLLNNELVSLELLNNKMVNLDGLSVPIGRKYIDNLNKF